MKNLKDSIKRNQGNIAVLGGAAIGGVTARLTDPRRRKIAMLKLKVKQGTASSKDKKKLKELRVLMGGRIKRGVGIGALGGAFANEGINAYKSHQKNKPQFFDTKKDLKRQYREFSKRFHPDMGGDPEKFKNMKAEFDKLRGK